MPESAQTPARRRRPAAASRRPRATAGSAAALMVIDHERIQAAAWAEFHTARKRLDQTARQLHRHEETDLPAYDRWLHRTFPVLVTTLRELHEELATKAAKVRAVQARAALYGGSLKRLWRQQKEREMNPEPPPDETDSGTGAGERGDARRREARPDDFPRAGGPAPSAAARDIYRRLVQRLHPDRGGAWTAQRQHLWHEVQQAWQAGDADWLSRLEVEWETAHEVVGPHSALSRLRRAIAELDAARRDIERKLDAYRKSPAWRFTRNEPSRDALHRRTEKAFAHDILYLRRQLDHLNRTIAAWEEDWTRSDSRPHPRRRAPRRY